MTGNDDAAERAARAWAHESGLLPEEIDQQHRVAIRAALAATGAGAESVICEWCPAPARGSAWHNDGRLHPSCGQIDHGQGWVPDEPARAAGAGAQVDREMLTSRLESLTRAWVDENIRDREGRIMVPAAEVHELLAARGDAGERP